MPTDQPVVFENDTNQTFYRWPPNSWPSVVSSANALAGSAAPVECVELAGFVILVARASRGDLLTVAITLFVAYSFAAVVVLVGLVAVEDP